MAVLRTLVLGLFATLAFALANAGAAQALPVFAHRYGFSCQQCHTTVPQLNAFGEYFQRSGFRLPGPARGTFPIAVKVNVAYSSSGDPGLPKAVVDEVELLSGGSIGRNTSYFVEQYALDGGVPGRPRDAWVQFDRPVHGSDRSQTTLRAKLGQFTLPLPVDPETERPTLAHYALYDQTVGENAFNFFDPRVGADLSIASLRTGLEAHAVLAQSHDTMLTLAKTFDDTWTATLYRYAGSRRLQPSADRFVRDGFALRFQQGPWDVIGSAQRGFDTSADGLGTGAASSGGYLSASYAFDSAAQLIARYDDVFSDIDGRTQSTTLSLVTRPARNMRFTLEASRAAKTTTFGTALLFAY